MIVDNYKEWYNRNIKVQKIIDEKRNQIEKLALSNCRPCLYAKTEEEEM